MKRLILSELNYHLRFLFISIIILGIWITVAYNVWGPDSPRDLDVIGFGTVAFSMSVLLLFAFTMDQFKHRRIQVIARLPLSPRTIATARIAMAGLLWLVIHGMSAVILIVSEPDVNRGLLVSVTILFGGFMLLVYSLYMAGWDLNYVIPDRVRVLGLPANALPGSIISLSMFLTALILVGLPRLGLFTGLHDTVSSFLFTPSGALFVCLTGCVSAALSVKTFAMRKAYLA